MKVVIRVLVLCLSAVFLTGCAAKGPVQSIPSFDAVRIDPAGYDARVDGFLVIFDASSSMGETGAGVDKFGTAKAVVDRMNQTLPELGQMAGFRSFGHDPSVSSESTALFYPVGPYDTGCFSTALDKVSTPGGISPLHKALAQAVSDLKAVKGQKAVIIVSDGEEPYLLSTDAVTNAGCLKRAYGSDVCIYTVHVGGDSDGRALMKSLADKGGCGFAADAENLMTGKEMAGFVKKVFLVKKALPEPDPEPAAPAVEKEEEEKIAEAPARKDSDQDGVFDDEDQCPGTPLGAEVNLKGCWSLAGVLFDYDKAVVRPDAYGMLDKVYHILVANPDMDIILKGHTDSRGSDDYNMDLSRRRAAAVQAYLIRKGIRPDRIETRGYGEAQPIASNESDDGRALNRRVEIEPVY